MDVLRLKHRTSSIKSPEKHRWINKVDFVLAYQKHRKDKVSKDAANDKMDGDIQRQRFFDELRSHGILVNVDDDPTVSIYCDIQTIIKLNEIYKLKKEDHNTIIKSLCALFHFHV